jgi:dUTP pyrophosphatase
MKLKISRLHPDAIIPTYAHEGDAGLDVYNVEPFEIEPGERKSIPLGIAIEIPKGYAALMWDKSGLSHKYGIKTFGGVIDSGYRGEIRAGLMNTSNKFFKFEKGQKVAQLLFQKVEKVTFKEVKELKLTTKRGDKGFGSSGK